MLSRTTALFVLDAQVGFTNEHSAHILPTVATLIDACAAAETPVVFTRYLNYEGSPFQRLLNWTALREAPETDIVPALAERARNATAVLDKTGYSCMTSQALHLIRENGWTNLLFCGIATDSCVLKSAIDAFELQFTPWMITDACASEAGEDVHDAGLVVARRTIGAHQLITSKQAEGILVGTAPVEGACA